ncbi:MAG TPA: Xaa-Pro peptidase family protein [Pirellulales bacterium]|jgi:Xaa-Pro aminopeptidase|nr:Xaa-Pro peptidase family protein [Pirellulales bacterium]
MQTNDINLNACRGRQRRLLERMAELQLDLVIVTQIEHVQWLTGPRFDWKVQPVAALAADGRMILVSPSDSREPAAADEVLPYDAKWLSTLRMDQRAASSQVLLKSLAARPAQRTIGVEFSSYPPCLAAPRAAKLADIEPVLHHLRRRKDPDELARIKKAIAATGAMYARAREIVAPGVNELDVFNELQAVAVQVFGEPLTGTGNDYACAVHGGPPRDRRAADGELYILDLGPAYRGYFADNSRTLAVGGRPSERQLQACEHVRQTFAIVERVVRPGKRCRELYEEVRQHLEPFPGGVWNSHLGHGIGLFPHEPPHLNPNWDDSFEAGDVIAVEPAIYAPDLRAGVRLENNYLVTDHGLELLSDFPIGLM